MQKTIDVLVEKAHEYMRFMTVFYVEQSRRHLNLRKEVFNLGGFDSRLFGDLAIIDQDTEEVPFLVADKLIEDIDFDHYEIQGMLERVSFYKKYSPHTFAYYGKFLSAMVARVLAEGGEITLDTKNDAIVHVPEFYMWIGKETSYPWKMEELYDYERENLLISHLGSRLKRGKLIVTGHVGMFFASQNNGADIQLDGECGWRSCYEMNNGIVTINGVVGHGPGVYARGGKIIINGEIKCIENDSIELYGFELYHNGKFVSSKK